MPGPDLTSVRALIFDLDGTLIDSKQDLILSVNSMLHEMGRTPLAECTISGYIGQGAPLLVRRALGEAATEEEVRQALEFFLRYYEDHRMDHTRAYPGVAEALAALQDFSMAVLTNKPVRISRRILEDLGLAAHFRVIYGGNSFEKKKPDPLGTHRILREFGVEPREALMVGDSKIDVQTARNAGTWAACVTYGFGVHDHAAFPPDIYLNRLLDLVPLLANHRARR